MGDSPHTSLVKIESLQLAFSFRGIDSSVEMQMLIIIFLVFVELFFLLITHARVAFVNVVVEQEEEEDDV